ncbi:MAG: hypothetical protein ACP5I8_00895 [Phycisphaerae bacterium]
MKSENTIIGLLTVSALLLAALLVLPSRTSNIAHADVVNTGGGITLLTSSIGFGSVDLLNIIDSRDGIMLVYTPAPNGNQLRLVGGYDLNRIMRVPSLR